MKKVLGIIIILAVVGIGYWLAAPLFIDKEVNETLDTETEAAVQAAIEKFREETKDTNIDDQMPEEEKEKMFMEMAKMEDKKVEEPMPEPEALPFPNVQENTTPEVTPIVPPQEVVTTPVGPTIEKTGSFVDVAHKGVGVAKLINLGDEKGHLVRFEDFEVDNGPDLRVLLSKSSNVRRSQDLGDYIEIGKLKGNIGTQNYTLPSNIDPEEYNSVIIYCKPFKVVFNSADLK